MALSHMELGQMLEAAVVAARLAGQRAMEEQRYITRSIKNGNELVTQADPICQKLIIDQLRQDYPDHGFLAEEGSGGKLMKLAPRSDQAIWWVIDPIDGTNNFACGLLCFSVSIAAFYQGRPVAAVIFDPATESMFTAIQDGDTQLNGTRIQVNSETLTPFAEFGIDSHIDPRTENGVRSMMAQARIRCLGSTALHLAYVAKGAFIGAVTTVSKLWDIAAGILLIEQAGGRLTDLDGNPLAAVDLDNYDGKPIPVLAANVKTQSDLLKVFNK